jgi:hypothetical protein
MAALLNSENTLNEAAAGAAAAEPLWTPFNPIMVMGFAVAVLLGFLAFAGVLATCVYLTVR